MINFLTNYYPLVTLAVALIALLYVAITTKRVLGYDEGTDLMKKISLMKPQNEEDTYLYHLVQVYFAIGTYLRQVGTMAANDDYLDYRAAKARCADTLEEAKESFMYLNEREKYKNARQ